jgi:HK97 gp10 family phage protein
MQLEIRGVDETIQNLKRIGRQLGNLDAPMRTATLLVTRSARINAPVDTGLLRASILPGSRSVRNKTVGIVGSNVEYAPYQEFGTRFIKPRRFLRRALEQNTERIKRLLNGAVARIVRR